MRCIFKKAPVPSIMTVVSGAIFAVVYVFLAATSVEPRYIENLIFAVPTVCFGAITFFTVTGKLKNKASDIIAVTLIFALGPVMFFTLVCRAFEEATTTTTDVGKYERVLKLTGYPQRGLTKYFPSGIPGDATNVLFSYNPAFMQGGQNFELKFNEDQYSIDSSITTFSQLAVWEGKAESPEAEEHGIFLGTFTAFGYAKLPDDFTVYVIYGKPYQPGNWNHGQLSAVAISRRRGEIIFHAEDW